MSRLVAFGDSISQGGGMLGNGPSYFPHLIAINKGWKISMRAVAGAMAADQADAIYAYVAQQGDKITYMIGINDERIYGADVNKLANFKSIVAAEAYYLASVSQNAKLWSSTGTWNANAPYTIGRVSTVAGSALTASFTGDVLTFGYIMQDGNAGAFSVTVDGVSRGNFNCFGAASVATRNGRSYAPALGRIAGCGAGEHTIIFTALNTGNVYLDWIGTGAGSSGIDLYLASIPRMTPAGYGANGGTDANVTAYSAAISALVAQMNGDGLSRVSFVDAGANVDPSTELLPDLLHPNAQGQPNIAAAFIAAM